MTVYGLYVYRFKLQMKHNYNDLAIAGDNHEYYTSK